jgi:hypothetical protein
MEVAMLLYEAPRDPAVKLVVRGVGRVADEPRAILVLLNERPTDDEMRAIHDLLRASPQRQGDRPVYPHDGDQREPK